MNKYQNTNILAGLVIVFCGYVAWGQSREKPKDAPPKNDSKAVPKSVTQAAPEKGKSKESADERKFESADHQAIFSSATSFAELYSAHDAKRLSALFAADGELINEEGHTTKGRAAIEARFASVFSAAPASSMQIDVQSVRILTPNVAIEEGISRTKESPEEEEEATAYVAIHSKVDGKWLLTSVRDWGTPAPELTPHDRLEELAWLIGERVEESADSVVRSKCTWHDNGNFLMQEFSVQIGGQITMSGTMRIGWDAVRKQFKSWVFDSHGGHAEGYWLRDGDRWIVKSQGATAAGEAASATNVYQPIDDETVLWSSFDRIVDGERTEDIGPITMKLRPPSPLE